MKNILTMLLAGAMLLSSCDRWIDEAETPNNKLTREQLNNVLLLGRATDKSLEDGALILGLKTQAATTVSGVFLALGAMTDEISPTDKPNVLLYRELKNDNISANSGQTDALWKNLHRLRTSALEVLDIEAQLNQTGEAARSGAVFAYARVIGKFYLALADELLSSSFADDKGNVFIDGKTVSRESLAAQALDEWKMAVDECTHASQSYEQYAPIFDLQKRYASSMMLRHQLEQGNYSEVKQLLGNVISGDETFSYLFNVDGGKSAVYTLIGKDAIDAQIDASLIASLRSDAERNMLTSAVNKNKANYWVNITQYAPLIVFDKTDVALIKAELILRGLLEGDVKSEINKVLVQYDAGSTLTSQSDAPTLADVAHLRHVFLFLRGQRIADFRRGLVKSSDWKNRTHRYMPVPEIEYQ